MPSHHALIPFGCAVAGVMVAATMNCHWPTSVAFLAACFGVAVGESVARVYDINPVGTVLTLVLVPTFSALVRHSRTAADVDDETYTMC